MIQQLANILKPRDIKGETNYDVILRHYLSHSLDDLPTKLKDMLERWTTANSLLREGILIKEEGQENGRRVFKQTQIAAYLVEYYGVSYRTANEDIANAKNFFAPEHTRNEKEFARGVMVEWGKEMMFAAYQDKDYKSAATFWKALAEVQGLDKDDPDLPNYAQVVLPQLVIVDDPSELDAGYRKIENPDELVKEILARRKKDKMDKLIEESELADYEDGANS